MKRASRRLGLLSLATATTTLLGTSSAQAHLISTGLGPVYDGAGHFLLSVEQLAPVLGLALLAGQRGPQHARWLLFTLTFAWLLGACAALIVPAAVDGLPWAAGSCLVVGLLVAADQPVSLTMIGTLAAFLGFFGSLSNALVETSQTFALETLGVGGAVFVTTALAASLIVSLKIAWLRVAVRVVGSWLAAVGLLLAGWTLHAP